MAYVDVTQHPGESAIDTRRRRRQELARGWKFACECIKCAADASVQTDGPEKGDGDDLGVQLERAKLEEVVARVEAELSQATVPEPTLFPVPEFAPYSADDDERIRQPAA